MYKLSKKRLREIKKLKDKKKSTFIETSSKLKHRYWLVVRLKVIKYKEDFFRYLSFYFYCQASLQAFIYLLPQDVSFFDRFLVFLLV